MHGSDSLYTRMATQPFYKESTVDAELEHKAKKVSDKFSETVNIIANEPSLAFFRIQEHVRKTLPQLVDQKHEVEDIQEKVQGACFDAEYATSAVKAMQSSAIHFQNIQDLLKNAMFMKQQINYEDNRRKQGRPSPSATPSAAPEKSKDTEPNKSGTSGATGESSPNEKISIPKPSLEDSDDSHEVEQYMAKSASSSTT